LKRDSLHSISTLSVETYYEIIATEELTKLKRSLSFASVSDLEDRWALINDEITEIVGQSDTFTEMLRLRISKAEHLNAAYNSGEKWRLTLAAVEEAKIKELEETAGKSVSLTQTLLTLSKAQGYKLNSKELTTLEYFTLINMSNDSNKK